MDNDDAPEPMDEQQDDEEHLPQVPVYDPINWPESNLERVLVSADGKLARWIEHNAKEPQVYPKSMKALVTNDENNQDMLGVIAVQFLWPMPVHVSPLYLMLARSDEQQAYRPRYVSSITMAIWLFQLFFYYKNVHSQVRIAQTPAGVEETETQRVRDVDMEYGARMHVATNELHAQLEPLYTHYSGSGVPEDFVRIMRDFTFYYIHLLERAIWQLADPNGTIALAQLLTPTTTTALELHATPQDQQLIHQVMRIKTVANNAQLERYGCSHMVRDWFPHCSEAPRPGEWLSKGLLEDYFRYMDVDGLLAHE